jgi:hypothetical protein
MLNKGYLVRTLRYNTKPYKRGEKMIYPFCEAEDLRILELRRDGLNPREIAAVLSDEFRRPRVGHAIDVRLKFLAAYENSPEEAMNGRC